MECTLTLLPISLLVKSILNLKRLFVFTNELQKKWKRKIYVCADENRVNIKAYTCNTFKYTISICLFEKFKNNISKLSVDLLFTPSILSKSENFDAIQSDFICTIILLSRFSTHFTQRLSSWIVNWMCVCVFTTFIVCCCHFWFKFYNNDKYE